MKLFLKRKQLSNNMKFIIFSIIVSATSIFSCGGPVKNSTAKNIITISQLEYLSLIPLLKQFPMFSFIDLTNYKLNDTLAKEFVQDYINTSIWNWDIYSNHKTVRSVFFTFKKVNPVLDSVNTNNLLENYGFRIYFAEYTSSDKAEKYLKDEYGPKYRDFIGRRTVIIQIMNATNDTFIYKEDGDLLNFNLGELCPPCARPDNGSGLNDDWYIQE